MNKRLSLLALLLVAVGVLSGCNGKAGEDSEVVQKAATESEPISDTSSESTVVEDATELPSAINAYDLLDEFKQDRSESERAYEGKTVVVTGVAVYTGPDVHNSPSIELSNTANGESYVLCVFPSSDPLSMVSKGNTVTISGSFHILGSNGMVVLKQSKILKGCTNS